MDQNERRQYLIKELLSENPDYKDVLVPEDEPGQRRMLRSLFNVRMPGWINEGFLKIQDEYLKEETERKGITKFQDLEKLEDGICLWQRDITTLQCDAIAGGNE